MANQTFATTRRLRLGLATIALASAAMTLGPGSRVASASSADDCSSCGGGSWSGTVCKNITIQGTPVTCYGAPPPPPCPKCWVAE